MATRPHQRQGNRAVYFGTKYGKAKKDHSRPDGLSLGSGRAERKYVENQAA